MSFGSIQNLRQHLSVLAVVALSLSACISNIHTPYASREPSAIDTKSVQPTTLSEIFDYPAHEVVFENHDLPSGKRDYELKQIQFASLHDNGQSGNLIRMRYYKHVGQELKPLVIVVPIYGSYTYPSEKIANGLLKSELQFNVALLEYEDHLFDFEGLTAAQSEEDVRRYLDQIRDRVIAAVVNVRRVIDWAEQQGDIDANRIAVVSFSMSALIGALLAEYEPRLSAGVIVMGAAHYHDILAVCAGRVGDAREAVTLRFGWSEQQYRQLLENSLGVLDPARYPGLADPSQLLMIDAEYDECMPQHTREALWESLGEPERITYQYQHKRSFLAMTPLGFNVMRRRIYDFFEMQLSPINSSGDRSEQSVP